MFDPHCIFISLIYNASLKEANFCCLLMGLCISRCVGGGATHEGGC